MLDDELSVAVLHRPRVSALEAACRRARRLVDALGEARDPPHAALDLAEHVDATRHAVRARRYRVAVAAGLVSAVGVVGSLAVLTRGPYPQALLVVPLLLAALALAYFTKTHADALEGLEKDLDALATQLRRGTEKVRFDPADPIVRAAVEHVRVRVAPTREPAPAAELQPDDATRTISGEAARKERR